jgi:5'-nucleotidase (lipoprotein e(P4) family)
VKTRTALAALAAGGMLGGCVAVAAVPIAAGATIGRKALRGDQKRAAKAVADGRLTLLPPGSSLPPPDGSVAGAPPLAPPPPSAPTVPPGMQYLYGSGEAAAASMQTWRALVRHVADKALRRPKDSVVLAQGSTLAAPKWVPCGKKPPAAVFDVDETVLLNLGFEYDTAQGHAYDPARWDAWEKTGAEKVVATPGAAAALRTLRTMGVEVVFNTNRSLANADATVAALTEAELGPAKHGETLWLQGDDDAGPLKDKRRSAIAARYCVLAMAGDQLGDFSDLFNAQQGPAGRRAETLSTPVNAQFGAGWFLFPNPVYGTALKGGFDDVFPQDMRWAPPATKDEN